MIAKLALLACLFLFGCGPHAAAEPGGQGSLALGASRAGLEGITPAPEEAGPFEWFRLERNGATVLLGYHGDMLGRVRLTPARPLSWDEAKAWARLFHPGFDEARVIRDDPTAWVAFDEVRVNELPFEIGLTFERQGEQVVAIRGEMNWLD